MVLLSFGHVAQRGLDEASKGPSTVPVHRTPLLQVLFPRVNQVGGEMRFSQAPDLH
jgi:hypothetical protein